MVYIIPYLFVAREICLSETGFRLLAALRVAIYLKKWKITAVMALIIKELCVYLQS